MKSAQPFSDANAVRNYAQTTPNRVPGFSDLHRMALLLLSESAPDDAKILVLGAGGGLELKCFAEGQAGWTFTGVDPSQPMLDIANEVLGPLGERVDLVTGYIDDAPDGPFDGATCFLTLHFLDRAERLKTLQAMRARIKPGAPVIAAHHCAPQGADVTEWLARSVAFPSGPAADREQAMNSAKTMAERLTLLTEAEEEALLVEAGFAKPAMFYAGFSFRGWVATAA